MPSKIIRGDEFPESVSDRPAPRPARVVVESEVYDAHQKAKDIIDLADQKAASIIERAQAEREATLASAREQGRQEGLAQATEVILRAKQQASQIIEDSEPQIVKLALAVAEKVIGRLLEDDSELVLSTTAVAIESVRHQRELVLRVNPEDAVLLRNSRKKLMDMLGRTKDIAVREDAEVARGGCIIETEHGTVDAQLKTQLAMLEQALLGDQKKA